MKSTMEKHMQFVAVQFLHGAYSWIKKHRAADGEGLVQKMALEGIPSAVIGRTTSGKERILRNGEEVRYLDKPQMDEMYRVGR